MTEKFAEVIVDISSSAIDKIFDYSIQEDMHVQPGYRVVVPFGNRKIEGYVMALKNSSLLDAKKIKPIAQVLDDMPVITPEMMALKDTMVAEYRLRTVDVLRLFMPSQMRGGRIKELTKLYVEVAPEYLRQNPDTFIKAHSVAQHEIFEFLNAHGATPQSELTQNFSASALKNLTMRGILHAKSCVVKRKPYKDLAVQGGNSVTLTPDQLASIQTIQADGHSTFLLHGVTGSGKTEVYMRLISDALAVGKTAIMLVPEIALTPQVLKNFRARFDDKVALLHSGLSAGERFDEWRRLLTGEALVALGARSAIFAPLQNVGVIIVDEEHDSSYNSDTNPRYSALWVAECRAQYGGAKLVLGSATPSVESYHKCKTDVYKLIEMPKRVNKKPLPSIEIVDMCREVYGGNTALFSKALESELHACVEGGNQAMLFINRRGYSSYVICRSCGHVPKCAACDVSLVYHKEDATLKCHYCNARYAELSHCPECKADSIRQGHVGTQRVVETLEKMFPGKSILRMDNDTTRTKDAHAQILDAFGKKESPILVGTQMIAKGHDFPSVTLVGILDADLSLHFADYRSVERTFSLITQVAGRAGREQKPGKVVLQTYTPRHYVYKYAVENDYKSFFEKECNLREVSKYPPFSRIVRVLVSGESEECTAGVLKNIYQDMLQLSKQHSGSFAYLAAMRAPLKRIQNKFRMQILVRIVGLESEISSKIYALTEKHAHPKVLCFVEQNPNSLS